MQVPIIIFHHALLMLGDPPEILLRAVEIAKEQMDALKGSGLLDAASEFHIGLNGGDESRDLTNLIYPPKAQITYHGLQCKNECRTVMMLREWALTHNEEAYCLYEHQKGSSHAAGSSYGEGVSAPWRRGMMQDLVLNWRQCVADLRTHDIVCSHWMWDMGADKSQHIPAGNFLWIKASFARQLPTIYLRDRIKQDGIDALSSRYESEVFWCGGPRPKVKSYRPNGGGGVP